MNGTVEEYGDDVSAPLLDKEGLGEVDSRGRLL